MTKKAADKTPEELDADEFASGWGTAAEDAGDPPPEGAEVSDAAAAAGKSDTSSTDSKTQKSDEGQGASGSDADDAGDGSATSSTAGDDDGDSAGAGDGDGTGDGDGAAGSPAGDQRASDGEETVDALKARLATAEQTNQTLAGSLAKRDREYEAMAGRVRKLAQPDGAAPGGDAGAGAGKTEELPAHLKALTEKVREAGDAETAEALETMFLENRRALAEVRTEVQSTREQAQSGQANAQSASRLDTMMPGIPWREYMHINQDTGALTHPEFSQWMAKQPYVDVQTFWTTEDPATIVSTIRSFEEAHGKTASPAEGAAGAGTPGNNGTETATQADPSPEDKAKAEERERKRKLQLAGSRGVSNGKGGGAVEGSEAANDFDSGWDIAAREEQREAQQAMSMRKHQSQHHTGPLRI